MDLDSIDTALAEEKPSIPLPRNEQAQPSPPPPYGHTLLETSSVSRSVSSPSPTREERLRLKRAADAARSLGMELSFDSGSGSEEEDEDELNEEEMRARYLEMKRQLRRRNDGLFRPSPRKIKLTAAELIMAARVADQALQTHEQVIAALSPQIKARFPHLVNIMSRPSSTRTRIRKSSTSTTSPSQTIASSSRTSSRLTTSSASPPGPSRPSPDNRPFRTIRSTDPNLPFPFHHHSRTQPPSRPRVSSSKSPNRQVIESEDRISLLEEALAEARDGEEVQRKLAARTRRDLEKLQREFDKTEERIRGEEEELQYKRDRIRSRNVNERRHARPTQPSLTRDDSASADEMSGEEEGKVGWGSTAFPEYTGGSIAGPSRLSPSGRASEVEGIEAVLQRLSTISAGIPLPSTDLGRRRIEGLPLPSPSRSIPRPRLSAETRKVRKRITKSAFRQSPSRALTPLTPRVTVIAPPEAPSPTPPSRASRLSTSSRISSSTPAQRFSTLRISSAGPSPHIPSPTTSPSPSFSSRLSTLRTTLSNTLSRFSPRGRTLGSELGDDWDQAHAQPHPFSHNTSDRPEEDSEDEWTESPAPLPPKVSAALSSLAIALAPGRWDDATTNGDSLSRGSLRKEEGDEEGFGLLGRDVSVRSRTGLGGLSGGRQEQESGSDLQESVVHPDDSAPPLTRALSMPERPTASRSISTSTTTSISLALAHRRINPTSHASTLVSELEQDVEDEEEEATTIPGKIVNNILNLLSLLIDFIEWFVLVVWRVCVELRHGRRTRLGL